MRDAEGIRAMRKRLDELIRHRVLLDKNDDELDARIRLQDMMTAQMYICLLYTSTGRMHRRWKRSFPF